MVRTPFPCSMSARTPHSHIRSPNWWRPDLTGKLCYRYGSTVMMNFNKQYRMWIVDSPSPSSSGPPTPSIPSAVLHNPLHGTAAPQATPSFISVSASPSVSAASLPGASMSGRLSGVVSLTDVLNLFARASGLNPNDPAETRRHRRRSSSSSLVRGSLDSARSSSVDVSKIMR